LHQIAVVVMVNRHIQINLWMTLLDLDWVNHRAIVVRNVEVDLFLLLDLDNINHFTVVIVVHGNVEVVLLLFLHFDRLHLAIELTLERTGLRNIE